MQAVVDARPGGVEARRGAAIDPGTSRFLDATRWIAAVAVVVAHVGSLLLVSDVHVAAPGLGVRLVTYVSNIGHLAVVVFFVVSGYLVGGLELLRVLEGRRFSLLRYGIARFSRIYTVVAPALVLTLVLDLVGRHFTNGSGLYTTPPRMVMYPVAAQDTVANFVGTLLMQQTILVPVFGGNGPLWSLANEWWYYVVFGLAVVAFAGARTGVRRVLAGAGVLLLLGTLPGEITLWLILWAFGAGLALVGRRWGGVRFGVAMGVMGVAFLVALLGMRLTDHFSSWPAVPFTAYRLAVDGVAALGFGLALLSARNAVWGGDGRVHRALAGFSFSLYAVHFPAMLFLVTAAHDAWGLRFTQPLSVAGFAEVAAMVVALMGVGWAFAAVTERHTGAVRDWLTRRLRRGVSPVR